LRGGAERGDPNANANGLRRWREEEQDRRDGGAFAFAFGSPLSAPPLKLTYHRSRFGLGKVAAEDGAVGALLLPLIRRGATGIKFAAVTAAVPQFAALAGGGAGSSGRRCVCVCVWIPSFRPASHSSGSGSGSRSGGGGSVRTRRGWRRTRTTRRRPIPARVQDPPPLRLPLPLPLLRIRARSTTGGVREGTAGGT
jgi:hypothetical protein